MRPNPVTEQRLDDLMEARGRLLLSIYLPTHRRGSESVTQDPLRLSNQLAAADERLELAGLKPRERSKRLENAHQLLDDKEFWGHQSRGLGLFINEKGDVVTTTLRRQPEAQLVVAPAFHLRPLFAEVDPIAMRVLVLTKGSVRLLAATEESIEEIPADLPASLEDVNWFVDRETQRQQHPGGGHQNRHGHDPRDKETHDLERFLREVDDSLKKLEDRTPLIVLGSERVVAGYLAITDSETIAPDNGGVSRMDSLDEIKERVLPLIKEHDDSRQRETMSKVEEARSAGRTLDDLDTAIQAATVGRIDEVVVCYSSKPVWGDIKQTDGEIEVIADGTTAAVDLLDRLLVMAKRTGAEISIVDDPPFKKAFVAVLRY